MFFQNVFDSEFRQSMVVSDRQYNITFSVPGNRNRNDMMICWNVGPYNLIANNILTFNFSLDNGKYYSPFNVTLPAAASVTADTIVNTLNADPTFAAWFSAILYNGTQVGIKSLKTRLAIKWYITNVSAETILRFNKKAPVVEFPSYFMRYTIEDSPNFPEFLGELIWLDDTDPIDQAIITEAGFDYTAMKTDWQLLAGRSEAFRFILNTYDGLGRLIDSIQFPAGAKAGDLAIETKYVWTVNPLPDKEFGLPYTLTAADILAATPP